MVHAVQPYKHACVCIMCTLHVCVCVYTYSYWNGCPHPISTPGKIFPRTCNSLPPIQICVLGCGYEVVEESKWEEEEGKDNRNNISRAHSTAQSRCGHTILPREKRRDVASSLNKASRIIHEANSRIGCLIALENDLCA